MSRRITRQLCRADQSDPAIQDKAGYRHAQKVAESLDGVAASVEVVEAREGNDAYDHLKNGGSLDDSMPVGQEFWEQSGTSPPAVSERRRVGIAEWRERGVVPLSELYEHPDLLSPMPWDFRPFTATGHISLLSAAPKVGKSTFMGLYAHAKATGGEFLGQVLSRGKVLIVAPDESWTTIGRRHKQLGSPPDQVYLWFDLELTIEKIAVKAAQLGVDLILVDTLSRVASVLKENDNAAWTRWFTENDHHFRDSSSAWLFSHHDRKGGGSDGEAIRGASAILGCVDIAFSLQRLGHRQDQRVLRMEGTRFDQVEDLIIQIDGDAYRVIGDRQTAAVLDNDEIMRVEEVLTDQPATVTEIGQALESTFRDQPRIPPSTLRRHLEELVAVGRAVPHGKGGHGDPYRYSKAGEPGQVVRSLEQSSGIPDNYTQPYTPNTDTLSKVAGEDLSTVPSPRGWTSGQPDQVESFEGRDRDGSLYSEELAESGSPSEAPGDSVRRLQGKADSLEEDGTEVEW